MLNYFQVRRSFIACEMWNSTKAAMLFSERRIQHKLNNKTQK